MRDGAHKDTVLNVLILRKKKLIVVTIYSFWIDCFKPIRIVYGLWMDVHFTTQSFESSAHF
jgi:hypothetical protein